jgi:hypothetical protein
VGIVVLLVADGIFAGLFLAGIWIARKRWRELLPLCYPYVYTLATLAPFYLVGRNIMNVYFVVLILGASALIHFWDRYKSPTSASTSASR